LAIRGQPSDNIRLVSAVAASRFPPPLALLFGFEGPPFLSGLCLLFDKIFGSILDSSLRQGRPMRAFISWAHSSAG
jgi:hypothetical protein